MITGFNTDIEHDGVVYHVQTEDKGVNSPLILSLVYAGGEILASKRSPYEDLIAAGFNEEVLAERLKRQHRLICAAINAGRINDLKGMGARDAAARASVSEAADTQPLIPTPPEASAEKLTGVNVTPEESPQAAAPADEAAFPAVEKDQPSEQTKTEEAKPGKEPADSPYTVYDPRRTSPLGELAPTEQGLVLSLIEEEEFRAGESFAIRILVQKQWQDKVKPVASASLSVKILGTTFRPKIYAAKSGRDGVAEVAVDIPSFTSGRAALLVRAVADGHSKEMRRVIKPAT